MLWILSFCALLKVDGEPNRFFRGPSKFGVSVMDGKQHKIRPFLGNSRGMNGKRGNLAPVCLLLFVLLMARKKHIVLYEFREMI